MVIKKYIVNRIYKRAYAAELDIRFIKRYMKFMHWCAEQDFTNFDGPKDIHHIVPRSWAKDLIHDPNNMITIPNRYHIFAHLLLMKTNDQQQMSAFVRTTICGTPRVPLTTYEISQAIIAKRYCRARPVINLTTGERFKSVADASRHYGCKAAAVSTGIIRGIRIGNCYWHYQDFVDKYGIEAALKYYERPVDDQFYVWNLTTQTMYKNAQQAAKQNNCSARAIYAAIERYICYKGCYWAFNREVKQSSCEQVLQHILEVIEQRVQRAKQAFIDSRIKTRKRIRDVTTGIEYESVRKAAAAIGVKDCTLSHALTSKQGRLRNHIFEYVN